ncbi:MAG: hypothetical protein AVDCRST_MAG64-210, partial [uncultured Phycisphaerae bacterium]
DGRPRQAAAGQLRRRTLVLERSSPRGPAGHRLP